MKSGRAFRLFSGSAKMLVSLVHKESRKLQPWWHAPRWRAAFVAILGGGLLAIVFAFSSPAAAALALALSLVAAHVAGNSLGTRLVEATSRRTSLNTGAARYWASVQKRIEVSPGRLARRLQLEHIRLPATVGCAAFGATWGGSELAGMYPDAPLAAVGLAVVSSGVLGGFVGFTASSFLFVLRQALREAAGNCDRGARPKAVPPSGRLSIRVDRPRIDY